MLQDHRRRDDRLGEPRLHRTRVVDRRVHVRRQEGVQGAAPPPRVFASPSSLWCGCDCPHCALVAAQISSDKMKGHSGGVLCMDAWKGVAAGDKKSPLLVLSGGADGHLVVWDGRRRKSLFTLKDHDGGAWASMHAMVMRLTELCARRRRAWLLLRRCRRTECHLCVAVTVSLTVVLAVVTCGLQLCSV